MNDWLPQSCQHPPDGCTLYCLPHAGGGSAIYHRWARLLPAGICVCPIRLPGRESRLKEPAIDDMDSAVAALMQNVMPTLKSPFALYGHSMGGVMAFEFAQAIARHALVPEALFVSASRAPHLYGTDELLHTLPDDEMIAALVRYYASGGAVTDDELEMMRLLADTIRADLKLLETYRYREVPPLKCPIIAVAATEDVKVTAAQVHQWKRHTSNRFTFRSVPGHHLFLREQEQALGRLIESKIGDPRR